MTEHKLEEIEALAERLKRAVVTVQSADLDNGTLPTQLHDALRAYAALLREWEMEERLLAADFLFAKVRGEKPEDQYEYVWGGHRAEGVPGHWSERLQSVVFRHQDRAEASRLALAQMEEKK